MDQPAAPSHTLALPNLLTYGRLAAVPAFAATHFFAGDGWIGLYIFIAASITDFFDGYLARAWGQQSNLGRILDPIADKLLVGAALLMLAAERTIAGWSLWAALIILSREILVSGLREFLAELNVRVAVSRLAKWKTGVQMVALSLLIAAGPGADRPAFVSLLGLTLLWVAALLTLYTGFDYFRAGLKYAIRPKE